MILFLPQFLKAEIDIFSCVMILGMDTYIYIYIYIYMCICIYITILGTNYIHIKGNAL